MAKTKLKKTKKSKTRKTKSKSSKKSTKTPKRVTTRTLKEDSATAHHKVIMMPFSTATPQPKIPDGEVISSLSRRLQNVTEIKNDLNQDVVDILMLPSLGLGCVAYHAQTRATTGRTYQVVGFPNQTVGFRLSTIGAQPWLFEPGGGIVNWRIVSQGLRLDLANSAEENNGWWEACRFHIDRTATRWSLVTNDNAASLPSLQHNLVLVPDGTYEVATNNFAMVEQPGYKTGLLKDLHKQEFRLLPKSKNCPMRNNKYVGKLVDSDINFDSSANEIRMQASTDASYAIIDQCLSDEYDAVLIRLHCRSNTGSGATTGSQLIANCIQNVEFCFDPTSDLATFMTHNKAHPKTEKIRDELNDSSDATMSRRKLEM